MSVYQDKLGPFCRSATDCTIILDAIRGRDPDDPSSRDSPLNDPFLVDLTKLTVGYLDDAEMEVSCPKFLSVVEGSHQMALTILHGYYCIIVFFPFYPSSDSRDGNSRLFMFLHQRVLMWFPSN
jgi:hypothetical protein